MANWLKIFVMLPPAASTALSEQNIRLVPKTKMLVGKPSQKGIKYFWSPLANELDLLFGKRKF